MSMEHHDEQDQLPDVMGLEDVAKGMGISLPHAYNLARQDKLPIPALKIGRQYRFSRRLYTEWLDGTYTRPEKEED